MYPWKHVSIFNDSLNELDIWKQAHTLTNTAGEMDVGAGEDICHIMLFFKGGERWKQNGIKRMWMKMIKESYCGSRWIDDMDRIWI